MASTPPAAQARKGTALIACVLGLLTLTTCEPQRVLEPSLAIADGTRAGGNPDFFFLPPLQPNPSSNPGYDKDGFDPTRRPTVVICRIAGPACATTQPAGFPLVFTMDGGPGGESVRLAGDHYHVNWHARLFALDPNSFYRIRVLVDGVELGFADVDIVSDGRDLRNVNTEEYVGLVKDRTLPIKFRIERSSVIEIAVHEMIGVSDVVRTLSEVRIEVGEVVRVGDTPAALPAVAISVRETIGVADGTAALPPASITVHETVAVTDATRALPPAVINVAETVGVADLSRALPPVALQVSEAIRVQDGQKVLPPVSIGVTESVGVRDAGRALPPVRIDIHETIRVADAASAT
jgi:hypothetical protein